MTRLTVTHPYKQDDPMFKAVLGYNIEKLGFVEGRDFSIEKSDWNAATITVAETKNWITMRSAVERFGSVDVDL